MDDYGKAECADILINLKLKTILTIEKFEKISGSTNKILNIYAKKHPRCQRTTKT